MRIQPILTDNIKSRIDKLESRIRRLEYPHRLEVEVVPFYLQTVRVVNGGFFRQLHYADIMRGSTVRMRAEYSVGFGDASIAGSYCDWELRYYQQIPNIYTEAQKTAGSNYVLLDSGRVNIILGNYTPQNVVMEAAITDNLRGTYGRFEIWNNGSTAMFGGRSYMDVLALEFVQ